MFKSITGLLICLGMAGAVSAQQVTGKLDTLLAAYAAINEFNGTALVAQNGHVLLEKGYGMANITTHTPNSAHTIFQIASVTKTFTSSLILKLAELRILSLEDHLNKYYPGYPHGDSITIKNLLTHTSGIYNYTQDTSFNPAFSTRPASEEKMRSLFENKPLDFSPGTGWNYSNSGYSMLGYIVQKATGLSYWDAMKKYIFLPAGMQHSGFNFAHLVNKNKATGYFSDNSDAYTKETPVVDSSVSFAAGAIYSTVGDLFRFHEALQQGKIIGKASQEAAYTPFKNHYGFGWIIDSLSGHKTVSHSGGIYGFRSNFLRVTNNNICIILLSNTETPALEKISKKLLAVVYHLPYKIPKKKMAVKISEDILKRYAGTYKIESMPLVIEIKLEDGALVAYPVKGPRSVLCPSDTSHFFIKGDEDFETQFITDSTGKVVSFVIDHDGDVRTAVRL